MYMVTIAARMSSSSLVSVGRHADLLLGGLDRPHGLAEGGARGKIERDRRGRKLAEMIDDERGVLFVERGNGAQRHLRARGGCHVNVFQRLGSPAELGLHLQHDPILA